MQFEPKYVKPTPIDQGLFSFGVIALDHFHIFEMAAELKLAGAECKLVYEPDPDKLEFFLKQFPEAVPATSEQAILDSTDISLVISAAVPCLRSDLGQRVMDHGKDYFTDKAPFTSLEQLSATRNKVEESGQKYMCCYSERLQNEAACYAMDIIKDGVIGKVIQVLGLGPHRLNAPHRPDWFFRKSEYGGIITDIGSHQAEQFLAFTGASDAEVTSARVHNYNHSQYPEFEDFGEFNLCGNNQASGYFRMDWFTPDGLRTWGDGRTVILGTTGYIELRKYVDLARDDDRENHVYIVTGDGEEYQNVTGKIGHPFFKAFILDCLNRTENAMTQAHCFKAAEISLKAQLIADNAS
jgi:predicted dehydrogenase